MTNEESFLRRLEPHPYGRAALNGECDKVAAAPEGARNSTLNTAALKVGHHVGGGLLNEHDAREALAQSAQSVGLGEAETRRTIDSGMEAGKADPIVENVQHSGQMRMATWLADTHQGKLLHVHGIGWHYWDGKRWTIDDIGAAKRAVIDLLKAALSQSLGDKALRSDVRKCESATGMAGVLSIASALTPFAATTRNLDADPYLLNVANGTLDLRTMELSPHNPADRLTKVTRAAYNPDAAPGDWDRFLTTVLPDDDVRQYVQRQSGVALLGKVVEHVLPIWTGTGANGKSTAIGGLCWALGDYAMTAEPDLLLHREGAHPTGQMDLMGRRLAVITETDEGRRFAEATMKRLTGGDKIKARYMRQDFVEFDPSHTPILVTNHLPTVSGDDPAVWRRLRVVPFDVVIPENQRDAGLSERLQHSAEEILTWCVAGWSEYRRIGLAEPVAVLARTDEYKADSDAVGRFITDVCVVSPAVKATTSQLYEGWQRWCAREGVAEMSMRAFGSALDRHGYRGGAPVNGKRWRAGIALEQ
ncbi:bacteriophage protein [Mycobacteroides abscessus subsp. abscessus]|nr:bacteriophage protein [Mycobacteroides abscessus subsp. abscessus]